MHTALRKGWALSDAFVRRMVASRKHDYQPGTGDGGQSLPSFPEEYHADRYDSKTETPSKRGVRHDLGMYALLPECHAS